MQPRKTSRSLQAFSRSPATFLRLSEVGEDKNTELPNVPEQDNAVCDPL
jgi:hypothetical protein